MHALVFLLLLAAPFWETAPPRQWSDEQLNFMVSESPWAQITLFRDESPIAVYLSTARPMREAEAEFLRRYMLKTGPRNLPTGEARREYETFLAENEGKVIVIAVRDPNLKVLAEAQEGKLMVKESYLKVGRKKVYMTGHFPPAPSDPVLRLVFPRPEEPVKELNFELYLPGSTGPYRQVLFRTKDLLYKGRIEM